MLCSQDSVRVFILLVCLSVFSTLFLHIRHSISLSLCQHYMKAVKNGTRVKQVLTKQSPELDIIAACSQPNLRILYFVHTAPNNAEKRKWLRSTIGGTKIAAALNSTIVFFVGLSRSATDQQAVEEEAEQERDIVFLNFTDGYRNLTYKFVQGMRWVLHNCRMGSTVTIVKMDDDILVNVFALSSYVSNLYMPQTTVHCSVHTGIRPLRNKSSKWYVSKDEYEPDVYPDYCAGAAVVMRPAVMRKLYKATTHVPFFWIDDVYVTGITAALARIPLVDIRKYFPLLFSRNRTAVPKSTLFVNTGRPNEIEDKLGELWESVIKGRVYKNRGYNLKVKIRARKRLPWLIRWIKHRT